MATIGRLDAVAELPNGMRAPRARRLAGLARPAPRVPDGVPQPGVSVLVNWAWNYLTYDRGNRIVADADLRRLPDP